MINKILDKYIKHPVAWDSVFTAVVILGLYFYQLKFHKINFAAQNLESLVNQMISSSIGIAGFLITALTIILTFKDNLKSRDSEKDGSSEDKQVQSGIELLFHSKHYKRIVTVFFVASIIMVLTFIYYCFIEMCISTFDVHTLIYLVITPLLFLILALSRCLMILFRIIMLQVKK
jgi:hypothetical protein